MEVLAWTGSERTTVPRFVMEHNLKIYPLAEPVVHKRRPIAPEGRLTLKEKVFRWIGEGLIRKVLHPEWITNAILIKLTNETWKVHMDYSGLNKACAKDMYPLPEEIEELASLMGYPYKCFLQLLKEYSQIRMAEKDEEKTGFHTEEGVYCFTHMSKELKNSAATLQRMMEKFLTGQRGRNVEIYLKEIVIKRKIEPDLVQDVKETLRKLKRFIPKLAELKHPLREARTRMETAKGPGWTNEAEEAFQKIKRKLGKLPTEGTQIPVSYVSRPLQGMEICYTPIEKRVQALIHTARSLRIVFRKHKVKVVTDGPMEETLKLSGREGRLGKWATEIRKEAIEEGSGIGIILVSPEEKMYSYVIRLKFKASNYAMGCEALLAGLAASASQGIKDLYVFIDSLTLVA
ncbi:reverse transcriptase domain-containing protein [Tanacetum coccineum]